jgi:hypothetical protein
VPDGVDVGAKARLASMVPHPLRPLTRTGYHVVTGRQFRRWVELTQRVGSRDPHTLTEHVRHKMAHDRRPLLTTFADKIAVRDHVAGIVGAEYLSTVHEITRDPGSIPWATLPRELVCKVSHGSGGAVIVWDGADPNARLPGDATSVEWRRFVVRNENAAPERMVDLCRHWMTLDFSWTPGKPVVEWAYQDVPPGVLVEELLVDADGGLPNDYKFFVFGGQVRLISVDRGRFHGRHVRDIMSAEWERLPVRLGKPMSPEPPVRPPHLDLMLEIASELGRAAVDFVRVDLYDLGDRVVFGELTNYPDAGRADISPPSFDVEWGRYWPSASSH